MATNINETNQVEEQPATYNRNFQVMLIAGLVFVVLVMVYASLFRSGPGEQQIEEQVQRELRKQAVSNPEQEFRARIKSQEQRLLQQREQDLGEQRDYIDEKTDELMLNNEQVLQELLSGAKSALESWEENETVRVRHSRQADFAFEFFAEASASMSPGSMNPGLMSAEPVSASTPTHGFLRQEQAVLAALRQDLGRRPAPRPAATGMTATDLALPEGNGTYLPVAQDGWAGFPGPGNTLPNSAPDSPGPAQTGLGSSRHFNLAGHPESDLAEPPGAGYALLSIGSVMPAKLDQKIISDFTGPYRCRIEQNVMDVTQTQVLIPAGSLCTGEVIQTGSTQPNRIINNRMALSVRWIVRPDGSKIKFLSRALDHAGIGAVKGRTDYHFMARLGGTAAFALLSSETARADYSSDGSGTTFESDVGQSLRETGAELASPYAGLVPTQTLDYGQKLRLFVAEDIYIRPWRKVYQRLLSQG